MPQQNQDQMSLGKHIHSQCKSNTKSKNNSSVIPKFSTVSVLLVHGEGLFATTAKVIHEQDRQMLLEM